MFITAGMDRVIKVWDTNIMKPADSYLMDSKLYTLHLSPVPSHHTLIAGKLHIE